MRSAKRPTSKLSVTRSEALDCRPVKNGQVAEHRLDSGQVLLDYPEVMKPWLAALVRRLGGNADRVRMRKLQLDVLGTMVWDHIDGRRSVRQIARIFAAVHQLQRREAEMAVTRFLRDLGRRGLIGLK